MNEHNRPAQQAADRPAWYESLRGDTEFPGRTFSERTIRQIERRALAGELGQHRTMLRLVVACSAVLVVCLGVWLAAGPLADRTDAPLASESVSAGPASASATAPAPDGQFTLAEVDGKYRLYADRNEEATGVSIGYDKVYLEDTERNIVKTFDWHWDDRKLDSQLPVSAQLADLDGDGTEELVVILARNGPNGPNGRRTQEVHAVTTAGLHELPVQDPAAYLEQHATSSVRYINGYIYIELTKDGQTYRKAVEATTTAQLGDRLDFGSVVQYSIATGPDRLMARATVTTSGETADSPRIEMGQAELVYTAAGGGLNVDGWNFEPASPASSDDKEIPLYAIQAGGAFLPLQAWDNKVDLTGLLGKPKSEHKEQLTSGADTLSGSWTKKLTYDGLVLDLFSPEGNGKTFWILGMTLTDDRYASSLGIRVGDSVAQLKAAYPTIVMANDGRTDPDNAAYALEDESRTQRLTFDTADGRVKEIRIQFFIP